MLSMISLGVAGYSPNSAHLWKDTCATMKKEVCFALDIIFQVHLLFYQIKHPYLRAAFSFLSGEDPLSSVLVSVSGTYRYVVWTMCNDCK